MKNKTEQIFKEISEKLSILIKLAFFEKELSIKDKVRFLSNFDISNQEISKILDISEKHVAKEKSLLKKDKRKIK